MSLTQAYFNVDVVCHTELQTDIINTKNASDVDLVFKRNDIEFFRLQGPNVVTNGPENLLLVNDGNVGISSSWMFTNTFANRSADSDTDFRGCISGGLNSGTVCMTYEHIPERLHIKTDAEVSEGRKLYLNTNTSKECYIHSFIESNVKILSLENNDISGQNRIYCGGNLVIDMSGSVLNLRRNTTVVAGVTLTGDLINTSTKKLKYEMKKYENKYSDIVKNIEPKMFKMNEEKEMGITTNHIGYIAEDVEENIPKEFEDIVVEQEGIKKLNYVKLSSVCWGAVREIIKENEELKNKVEHLEASGFELQEAIKELVKPKPKAKTKAKAKAEK